MSRHKSVLYRVTKQNESKPHYVFGTMHLNNEDAYTHAEMAKKYILLSEHFYAEMELFQEDHTSMIQHFLLPESQTLQDLFKPLHYEKIKKILKKAFNTDIDLLNRFIPFHVQTMIAESLFRKHNRLPLDYFLWQYASENSKIMGGVESVASQIQVLKQIPLEYQIKSLRSVCKNIQAYKQKMLTLSNAYKNGDIQMIYRLSKKQLGSLRKTMLYDRNIFMGRKIFESMDQGPSFFAVGAGHLYGQTGILASLKKQKCKVKAILD